MWIYIIFLLPLLILTSGCLPTTPEVEVIERHCALVDLQEKPNVPAIEWIEQSELQCLDTENYNLLKQRESLIKTYANYCINVYEGAQKRCKE